MLVELAIWLKKQILVSRLGFFPLPVFRPTAVWLVCTSFLLFAFYRDLFSRSVAQTFPNGPRGEGLRSGFPCRVTFSCTGVNVSVKRHTVLYVCECSSSSRTSWSRRVKVRETELFPLILKMFGLLCERLFRKTIELFTKTLSCSLYSYTGHWITEFTTRSPNWSQDHQTGH